MPINLFRNLTKLSILFLVLIVPSLAYSQGARALFSNSSGVSLSAQMNEVEAKESRSQKEGEPPKTQSQNIKSQKPTKNTNTNTSYQAYSGLNYKILQEQSSGEFRQVSPDKVFRTGDRIKVLVTSNKSGELSVSNIDSAGKVSTIGEQSITAGVPMSVPATGALKFVGTKGAEQLIFVLSKNALSKQNNQVGNAMTTIISSCFQNKATRALIVDDSAGNGAGVVNANGQCSNASAGKTRDLVVEVSENSGYAVMPEAALAEGQMLTLKINLRHQ